MADISKIQVGDTTYNLRDRNYCTCSTGASTADKTASLDGFVLTTGSAVKVKFTNTNTAANPTLNINSTGAKPIIQYGTTVAGTTAAESWDDGAVVEFVYDGTNWVMQGRNTIDAVSKANGGTFSGDVVINDEGATTSSEVSMLTLGNSTATGTVGNSNGMIRMYGQGDKYLQIRPITTSGTYTTANRTIMFPDESGTLMTDQGGTFRGEITVDEADGTAGSSGWTGLKLGNNKPIDTAGNSAGYLRIYGTTEYYGDIGYATNKPTATRQYRLPDADGTIALTNNPTDITVDKADGTTSTEGWSSLILGNNKAAGTAGNSGGDLQIFGRTAYKTEFIPRPSSPTANRVIYIPDANGTLALGDSSVRNVAIQSTRSTGWVTKIAGTDSSDKAFQVGFDYRGGVYCYYDGSLQWNIRPEELPNSWTFADLSGGTLTNATGTIAYRPAIATNGNIYYMYGRLTITSFVRTGPNPYISFSTSYRPSHELYGELSGRFEADVMKPERCSIKLATSGVLTISNTETYFNMTSNARVIWLFPMVRLI